MNKLDKASIWEMVQEYPEYMEGLLTEEQAAEIVDHLYTHQEEIVRAQITAEVRRTLMEMVAKGEAEYDPETGKYRYIGPRP